LRDDDAFAGGESIGFDDLGIRLGAAVGEGLMVVGEADGFSGGNAGGFHDFFGESFAAFEPGSVSVRTENGDVKGAEAIGESEAEGGFGADDDEVGAF
jgi:hypothetical protein